MDRRVSWRWYDEVFNTADHVIRERILSHLQTHVREEGMLCFVVDHRAQGIEKVANHVLSVSKEAGGTLYRWE